MDGLAVALTLALGRKNEIGFLYAASSGLSAVLGLRGVFRMIKRSTLSGFSAAHSSAYCPKMKPCIRKSMVFPQIPNVMNRFLQNPLGPHGGVKFCSGQRGKFCP